jgi:hypothetical protein
MNIFLQIRSKIIKENYFFHTDKLVILLVGNFMKEL